MFPFVQVKSGLFGNLGCSMPFVNYGGPCADTPDIEHALLERARAISRELKLNYLEIRSRRHLGDALPCNTHKVSLTLALPKDPDVLWKAFKTGHRQEIRRGYKHGFVTRFGGAELLEPFYEIMSESWRNLGTPLYNRALLPVAARDLPGRDAPVRRLRRRRTGRRRPSTACTAIRSKACGWARRRSTATASSATCSTGS